MNKKNILLSVALIVVAILAGCSNQSMYPKFPVSALIRQTGDVVEGQVFDASKFEVVVNYLDNTTQTISGAGIQWTDGADKVAGMSADDTLTVNVGNDYYGKPVTNTISPSVYAVDHITAEAKSGVEFTVGTAAKSTDFVVSAYYTADKFIVLNAADYTVVATEADTKAEGYDAEAEEVPATVKITFGTYEYTLNVTAANPQTPDPVMIGIFSVELAEGAIVLGYDYETLPEITAADVTVKALTETKNTFDLTAAQLADAEFSFVNATTQLPLRADEYDFTQYTTTSNVAIKVVLGDYEKVSNAITVTAPEVTVKYTGKGIVENEKLVADPSDFYVTVKEGTSYRQLTGLTADDFIFSNADDLGDFTEGTGYENAITEAPEKDGDLYAFVVYQGVESTIADSLTPENKITVLGEAAAEITDVTFSVDTVSWSAPAKQYYDSDKYTEAVTAPTSTAIKDFKVTMSKGEAGVEQAIDKFTFALYTAEGKAVPATVAAEYDGLANIDSILVGAYLTADAAKEDKVVYYSAPIKLATPEITTLKATVEAGKVVGSAVKDVTVVASNANGVVNKDFTAYGLIDVNGADAELPETVGASTVTYTMYLVDDPTKTLTGEDANTIVIPAGIGYVKTTGVKLVSTDTEDLSAVGTAITADLVKKYYKVDENSYDIEKGSAEVTAPAITSVNLNSARKLVAGENSIPVIVTYVDETGESTKEIINVTIVGTPYVTSMDAEPVLLYNGEVLKKFEQGTNYTIANFSISSESYKGTDGLVISNPTVTCTDTRFVTETTVLGDLNSNYTLTFTYYNTNNLIKTEKALNFTMGVYQAE